MQRIYARVGGRKVFAQYLALSLLTGMAFALRADFSEYALAVGGVLGIAVGGIAYEDAQRQRARAACCPDGGEAAEPPGGGGG
ncbi:MAG TPA: hypothetical protein VF263_01960 [Longimicrobiaceae bacterium]